MRANKYWLIGAMLTPGDQMWSCDAAVAATTYSGEVQAAAATATAKHNTIPVWDSTKVSRLHFNDLQ